MLRHLIEQPKKDQFIVLQQELEQYVINTFTYPDDIMKVVRDMTNPLKDIIKEISRKSELEKEFEIDKLSDEDKE